MSDDSQDDDKLKKGVEALKEFFDQFGENDIYKQILLEVLLEELFEESNN